MYGFLIGYIQAKLDIFLTFIQLNRVFFLTISSLENFFSTYLQFLISAQEWDRRIIVWPPIPLNRTLCFTAGQKPGAMSYGAGVKDALP
jgi:hypothetical protein